MYSAADLKKGLKIEIDGIPYAITEFDFCKPGKGTALYRCKLKNLINGSTMDRTFRPVDKVDTPDLEEKEMFYSYHDGNNYIFSDAETYEEIQVSAEQLGDKTYFLIDNMTCACSSSTASRSTLPCRLSSRASSPKRNPARAATRLLQTFRSPQNSTTVMN